MKCLSLWQPWASLVILGAKSIETRSWATKYRGRLLIHAARQFRGQERRLCHAEPFRSALLLPPPPDGAGLLRGIAAIPLGLILGAVELVDCVPTQPIRDGISDFKAGLRSEPPITVKEYAFGDYLPGRWAWILRHPEPLSEPVYCRGRQGLFDVPSPWPEGD